MNQSVWTVARGQCGADVGPWAGLVDGGTVSVALTSVHTLGWSQTTRCDEILSGSQNSPRGELSSARSQGTNGNGRGRAGCVRRGRKAALGRRCGRRHGLELVTLGLHFYPELQAEPGSPMGGWT